jgi:GNAT superfamily N-acetyltransferase
MPIPIRQLSGDDAQSLRDLRQRALAEHPEAFGSAPEEEAALTLEQFTGNYLSPPLRITLGAFAGDQLVGIASLLRWSPRKTRHKAMVTGMYVAPEARGAGLGRVLLEALIEYARGLEGLRDLSLAVTVTNTAARTLYQRLGFVPFGIESDYIYADGAYHSIEWMLLRLDSAHEPLADG